MRLPWIRLSGLVVLVVLNLFAAIFADNIMKLGEKITRLRKEKQLSQIDIAKAVGVSRDAISKYERGDIVPSVENAKKIADTLGISLDYLVSAEDKQDLVDNYNAFKGERNSKTS